MPPELFDVLDACPATKTWKTRHRPAETDLAGLRDRALLLVGFVAARRRSELAALRVDHLAEHPNGLVLSLPRSKTNQTGEQASWWCCPASGTRPAPQWPPCRPDRPPPRSAPGRCCGRCRRATGRWAGR